MTIKPHLEEEIIAALRRIFRAIAVHSHRLRDDCGLTVPQLLMLRMVAKFDELTVSALARAMTLSQSTTSDIVRRLARQGLVKQETGQDRRSRLVRITEEGERRALTAPSLLQERFQAELEKREQYEQTQILATLQEIASMMEAEDLQAAPILATGRLETASKEE